MDTEKRKVKIVLNLAYTKEEEVMNMKKFSRISEDELELGELCAGSSKNVKRKRMKKIQTTTEPYQTREPYHRKNYKNPSCSRSKKHRNVLLIV